MVPAPPWCTSKWTLPRPYGNVVQPPTKQSYRRPRPVAPPQPVPRLPTPTAAPKPNDATKEARERPEQGIARTAHRVSSLLHPPSAPPAAHTDRGGARSG